MIFQINNTLKPCTKIMIINESNFNKGFLNQFPQ